MKNKKKVFAFLNLRQRAIFDIPYEGDGDGGGDGGGGEGGGEGSGDGGGDGGGAGGGQGGGAAKTFTEDQVNKIVQDRLARAQKDTEGLSSRVEDLTNKVSMSQQEKDEIAAQLEEANNRYKTAEQIAAEKAEKAQTAHAEALRVANDQTAHYKGLYETNVIDQAITGAMGEFEAMPGPALPAILSPMTVVKETVDTEGKPTGKFAPVVSYPDVDDDKNPVTLDLSVRDAVKRMSEDEQYGNLFKGKGTGGVGGGNAGGGRAATQDVKGMSAAEYQRQRKEKKLAHQQ
jgi:hypothetical protein